MSLRVSHPLRSTSAHAGPNASRRYPFARISDTVSCASVSMGAAAGRAVEVAHPASARTAIQVFARRRTGIPEVTFGADMDNASLRIVGMYESEETARAAAEAARAAGAPPEAIRVGEPLDRIASVQGEMRAEMDHTVAGPGNVGP